MKLLPIPDDREAWHALRAVHVGASEVAALFGVQPDYAPGLLALWLDKSGRHPLPKVDNPRTQWGLRLEDAIAAAAAEREGWDVLPGLYASRDGLGATLDRRIAKPGAGDEGAEGPGVLELKNADWIAHRRAWGDEPPTHILLQLQAQLAATGYGWGAIAVLVGGNDLRIYRYSARPKLQAEILRRVAAFWASVRAGTAPKADGSDATWRALAAVSPEIEDEPAPLDEDNEAPVLAAEAVRLAAERREIEKREAEVKAQLLQKLGAHRWATVPGYRISQAITAAKPDRPAVPGEVIKGRAESRRLIVSER